MQFIFIILFCILSAVCYGVVRDQITARICVEYFTIGHPPVFDTTSPTLLGLGWSVIATWWVGLFLGFPLALVARCGIRPKITVLELLKPVAILLVCMGAAALVAGVIGYVLASNGSVGMVEPLAAELPQEKHVAFLTDLWAHSASYLFGFLGGIVLIIWTWRKRRIVTA